MFSIKDFNLGLDHSGQFIRQGTVLEDGKNCYGDPPASCDCLPDSDFCFICAEVEDPVVTAIENLCTKLEEIIGINSGITTSVSGQTFLNTLDTDYFEVCVMIGDCKKEQILKVITNPITCEIVSTQLYELDYETVVNDSFTIVPCKDDEVLSTEILKLCKVI